MIRRARNLWRALFGKTDEMREVKARADEAFDKRAEVHSAVMQMTEQIATDEIREAQKIAEIMRMADREGNGEAVVNGS